MYEARTETSDHFLFTPFDCSKWNHLLKATTHAFAYHPEYYVTVCYRVDVVLHANLFARQTRDLGIFIIEFPFDVCWNIVILILAWNALFIIPRGHIPLPGSLSIRFAEKSSILWLQYGWETTGPTNSAKRKVDTVNIILQKWTAIYSRANMIHRIIWNIYRPCILCTKISRIQRILKSFEMNSRKPLN